jgi:hypothetical protein
MAMDSEVCNFVIVKSMNFVSIVFDELVLKFFGKEDGTILLHVEFSKAVQRRVVALCEGIAGVLGMVEVPGESDIDVCAIAHTVGKYVLEFSLRKREVDERANNVVSESSTPAPGPSTSTSSSLGRGTRGRSRSRGRVRRSRHEQLEPQPDWGLHLIAGGTLGKMFKYAHKKKDKVRKKVLSAMIQPHSAKKNIPVQQMIRDRGGLYCMKLKLTPSLRQLDQLIGDEFNKPHGKNLVRVSFHKFS